MNMQTCPECNGAKQLRLNWAPALYQVLACPTCEGTGTIPDEPVSHCAACGEPIPLGDRWCGFHQAAALLEPPLAISENLVELVPDLCEACDGTGQTSTSASPSAGGQPPSPPDLGDGHVPQTPSERDY